MAPAVAIVSSALVAFRGLLGLLVRYLGFVGVEGVTGGLRGRAARTEGCDVVRSVVPLSLRSFAKGKDRQDCCGKADIK